MNNNNSIRYLDHNYIQLSKVGRIKFRGEVRKHERILSAVIELTPIGKCFVSLCVEVNLEKRLKEQKRTHGKKTIGIDLGIKSYVTSFDGLVYSYIENPKALEGLLEKLGKEQRKLSRMREKETEVMKALGLHSRNYEDQRVRVARVHERITNISRDFMHKLSRRLCNENQVIVVENLRVRSILECDNTTRLKRSIAYASWSAFLNMLEYKAEETECIIKKVESNYPSTKWLY